MLTIAFKYRHHHNKNLYRINIYVTFTDYIYWRVLLQGEWSRKLLLLLKQPLLPYFYWDIFQFLFILGHLPRCTLNETDDLYTLLQRLQGYSRPSMWLSMCSLIWLILFDLCPQLVQKYPSIRFSIINWICAIVSGSTIEFCFAFVCCIGTISPSKILVLYFTFDITLSVLFCFWSESNPSHFE